MGLDKVRWYIIKKGKRVFFSSQGENKSAICQKFILKMLFILMQFIYSFKRTAYLQKSMQSFLIFSYRLYIKNLIAFMSGL